LGGPQVERLGADRLIAAALAEPEDSAEAARVDETQLPAVIAVEDQVAVGANDRGSRFDRESASHAQMNEKSVAVIQQNDDAFAAARDGLDESLCDE